MNDVDVNQVLEEARRMAEEADLAGLVKLLMSLRDFAAELRLVVGEVETLVAERVGRGCVIDGLAQVTVERPKDRRNWQSEDLFRTVVRRIADPDGTGEVAVDGYELVARLFSLLPQALSLTGSTPWKVAGLRALGLDPDEWCEARPGRPVVKIQPLA